MPTVELARADIEKGLQTLSEWFPEDAETVAMFREQIVDHATHDTVPEENAPLRAVEQIEISELEEIPLPSLTPCEQALAVVSADVVLLGFGIVGLHVANQQRLVRELVREMGSSTLLGLGRAIRSFQDATGGTAKARALSSIMGGIYRAGGFRAALLVLKEQMSFWEWVKTGAIALAQIAVWFSTDGVALIAEVSLNVIGAEQLIEDSAKAVSVCDQE